MSTNTTAGRTRTTARLLVGTATAALAIGLGGLSSVALAGPVTGPTDIAPCPTYGFAGPAGPLDATFAPRPTELTFVPPVTTATLPPKPQVELPDATLVLPPPVGDPEPTGETFTAPTENPDDADCGYDPETTEPTTTTETPQPGGGGDTPGSDIDDLAYTGVGAGVMTIGGLGLLGVGLVALLLTRHLGRRVG